jgi:hypothetical protein
LLNGVGWEFPEPLADFVGASQISSADTSFTWTNRPHFMPLVTAGQKPIFTDIGDTVRAMASQDFDPRTTVYLPLELSRQVTVTNFSTAKILQSQTQAQRTEFTVEAQAPSLVVVAQVFYNPWHAYVDGQRVELWTANGAFQALQIPAGRHEVKIVYEDRMFEVGAAISLLSLVLLGALWFRKRVTQSAAKEKARIL